MTDTSVIDGPLDLEMFAGCFAFRVTIRDYRQWAMLKGDTVVVKIAEPKNGDRVVVTVDDGPPMLRTWTYPKQDTVTLETPGGTSLLHSRDRVRVLGVVVGVVRVLE